MNRVNQPFPLAYYQGGSLKLFPEMLTVGTERGSGATPDGGDWLGWAISSADRVLSRSLRPKLRIVGSVYLNRGVNKVRGWAPDGLV